MRFTVLLLCIALAVPASFAQWGGGGPVHFDPNDVIQDLRILREQQGHFHPARLSVHSSVPINDSLILPTLCKSCNNKHYLNFFFPFFYIILFVIFLNFFNYIYLFLLLFIIIIFFCAL